MAYDVWRVGGVPGGDTSTKGLCQYRTSGSGTGKLLVSALTVADTATFRGPQTLAGAVSITDSDVRLTALPSGNDTSAFGIGRLYTDTTSYVKITKG